MFFFEQPAAITEHSVIRLRGDHFSEKQIVARLIVRSWHDPAFEPGDASLNKRRVYLRGDEGSEARMGKLVYISP